MAAEAGNLERVDGDQYEYTTTILIQVTHVFAMIAGTWLSTFIIDCQNMVLAGAFARWYFTR